MKKRFLSLGSQPIANNFRDPADKTDEFKFDLNVTFDDDTKLVSLESFVSPEMMFNDSYVYHSSMSQTMRDHFKEVANSLINEFSPEKILEIGSNDGVFIKNFRKETTVAVEPCGNFAKHTNDLGYKTYNGFWESEVAKRVISETEKKDLIFSANCMCHIQNLDDAFILIEGSLEENGIFVFEDPSLLLMLQRGSYDQIYDEHAHIFSVTALKNILEKANLDIFRVNSIPVHGGSNRIFACRKGSRKIEDSVEIALIEENKNGLNSYETYKNFADNVKKSKEDLIRILNSYKAEGKKICSYGATSKSTTIFNYCQIGPDLIDYIVDTTPDKQGKLSPGVGIPVISPSEGFNESIDVAFLGAWNFKEEIIRKEKAFIERGGVFITHVPTVQVCK